MNNTENLIKKYCDKVGREIDNETKQRLIKEAENFSETKNCIDTYYPQIAAKIIRQRFLSDISDTKANEITNEILSNIPFKVIEGGTVRINLEENKEIFEKYAKKYDVSSLSNLKDGIHIAESCRLALINAECVLNKIQGIDPHMLTSLIINSEINNPSSGLYTLFENKDKSILDTKIGREIFLKNMANAVNCVSNDFETGYIFADEILKQTGIDVKKEEIKEYYDSLSKDAGDKHGLDVKTDRAFLGLNFIEEAKLNYIIDKLDTEMILSKISEAIDKDLAENNKVFNDESNLYKTITLLDSEYGKEKIVNILKANKDDIVKSLSKVCSLDELLKPAKGVEGIIAKETESIDR